MKKKKQQQQQQQQRFMKLGACESLQMKAFGDWLFKKLIKNRFY